jgi:hypothetical protein
MSVRRIVFACLLCLGVAAPTVAQSVSSIDAAGTCLADNTSGRDRKDLVMWVFLAMSKHPEIRTASAATPKMDDDSNRMVGALFTRLVAEDCRSEIRAMIKEHGPSSISKAFEVLGRVAMQELMSHPDVESAFSGLDQYTDKAKLEPVFE